MFSLPRPLAGTFLLVVAMLLSPVSASAASAEEIDLKTAAFCNACLIKLREAGQQVTKNSPDLVTELWWPEGQWVKMESMGQL